MVESPATVSEVLFGCSWQTTFERIEGRGSVIITDHNIDRIYGALFPKGVPVIAVKPGEESKSISTIEDIVSQMVSIGIDREGFVLGIGGGVVCDIAGFVASVYMRGVEFGFISTSLLSQVDASTGGKNGINVSGSKNVIGLFNQPRFVICDSAMLKTLPESEYFQGLSELLKAALIADRELLETIISLSGQLSSADLSPIDDLVFRAVEIKASVVTRDEREHGVRRILNFGHTFGHAAELCYNIPHGNAVAWGMLAAIKFSRSEGYLSGEDSETLAGLIESLNILPDKSIDVDRVADRIQYDKKRSGEGIHFVFLRSPGEAFTRLVSISDLALFLRSFKL